jgi:hypothetical protein
MVLNFQRVGSGELWALKFLGREVMVKDMGNFPLF